MIGILSSVANLATTFIDSKAKIKQAEAETKMKLATGEISWEQAAIEASADSWKGVDPMLHCHSARQLRALATALYEAGL